MALNYYFETDSLSSVGLIKINRLKFNARHYIYMLRQHYETNK
jgi:hypothetical protein